MEEKKESRPKISMNLGRIPKEDEFRVVACATRKFVAGLDKSGFTSYNIEVVKITFWPGDCSVTFEIVISPLGVGKFSIEVVYCEDRDFFWVKGSAEHFSGLGKIERLEKRPLESQIAAALSEAARVATLITIRSFECNVSTLNSLRRAFMRGSSYRMETVRSDIAELLKR